LKVKNTAVQVWDVAGVATSAAVVAKSSVVASTFFAPSGFLAAIGIGTAVTPIGWVIAAGVVTGGAWFGITRHLKKASASRVTVAERKLIHDYFVKKWGYDPKFVAEGIRYIESNLSGLSIRGLAQTIADFTSENRDCNFEMMSQEILGFLRNIVAVDSKIAARDEKAIENIEAIFNSTNKFSFKKKVQGGWGFIRKATGKILLPKKSKRAD
jgi:hypothetical protein